MRREDQSINQRSRKVFALAVRIRHSKGFSFVSITGTSRKNTTIKGANMFRIFRPREWIAILMICILIGFLETKFKIIARSIAIGILLLMNWELDKKEDKGFKI